MQISTIAIIAILLVLSAILPTSTLAQCDIVLDKPSVQTTHHGELDMLLAGEGHYIVAEAHGCQQDQSFVAVFEVRDSRGFTGHLSWVSGMLSDEIVVVSPWVPTRGGIFEVRAFMVTDLALPRSLTDTIVGSAEFQDINVPLIVIPYNPDREHESTRFEPYEIRVVAGVNSTVRWVNEDSVSHKVRGVDPQDGVSQPLDIPIFLYPGQFAEHTFSQEGRYAFYNPDSPDRYGYVRVFPKSVLDTYIDITINGLKDEYSLDAGEPAEYSLDFRGFETQCGKLKAFVQVDRPSNLSYFYELVGDCFGRWEYREFTAHYPMSETERANYMIPISKTEPAISEQGKYRLVVTFVAEGTQKTYTASKEFVVT